MSVSRRTLLYGVSSLVGWLSYSWLGPQVLGIMSSGMLCCVVGSTDVNILKVITLWKSEISHIQKSFFVCGRDWLQKQNDENYVS
jgi:hypothetical protein